jgi:hypothetical protein
VPTVAEIGLENGDAASFLPKNEHDWLSRAILQVTFTYDISMTLCDLMPALPCSPCVDRAAFLTLPFSSFPTACDEPEEPEACQRKMLIVSAEVGAGVAGGPGGVRSSGGEAPGTASLHTASFVFFLPVFLWCTVLWSICDTSFTCD